MGGFRPDPKSVWKAIRNRLLGPPVCDATDFKNENECYRLAATSRIENRFSNRSFNWHGEHGLCMWRSRSSVCLHTLRESRRREYHGGVDCTGNSCLLCQQGIGWQFDPVNARNVRITVRSALLCEAHGGDHGEGNSNNGMTSGHHSVPCYRHSVRGKRGETRQPGMAPFPLQARTPKRERGAIPG